MGYCDSEALLQPLLSLVGHSWTYGVIISFAYLQCVIPSPWRAEDQALDGMGLDAVEFDNSKTSYADEG